MVGHTVRNLCRQLLLGSLGALWVAHKHPPVQAGSEQLHNFQLLCFFCFVFFSHPRLSSAADWKTPRPWKLLRSHFPAVLQIKLQIVALSWRNTGSRAESRCRLHSNADSSLMWQASTHTFVCFSFSWKGSRCFGRPLDSEGGWMLERMRH